MSIENNVSQLKVDYVEVDGVKKQDIELTEFIKYVKLVPELRHHVLTYCTGKTLSNYSQCSNFSNSDVQAFNTKPPETVVIKEESDGINVKLCYKNGSPRASVEKKLMFAETENAIEEIQKYLMKYYKYVRQETTLWVEVDVKKWPMDLMKWKHFVNARILRFAMHQSMYNECMEFLGNIDATKKRLWFSNCAEVADRITIPPAFFKSAMFKKFSTIFLHCECEIESEDFINMEKEVLVLQTSISFEDIREKVRKWSRTNHETSMRLRINLPDNDDRVFDLGTIFPVDQFDGVLVNGRTHEKFQMGNVVVFRDYNIPKSIQLNFAKDPL